MDKAVFCVPDDWAATCAIFDIDENDSLDLPWCSSMRSTCRIEIKLVEDHHNLALVQRAHSDQAWDPHFYYHIIRQDQSPILEASFHYSVRDDDANLESATVKCTFFPYPWPHDALPAWLSWLHTKIKDMIDTDALSYPVCEFLHYRSLDFFHSTMTLDSATTSGIFLCLEYPVSTATLSPEAFRNVIRARYDVGMTEIPSVFGMSAFEVGVRKTIRSRWKEWVTISCPICLECLTLANMMELVCRHHVCRDCLSGYSASIVDDIRQHSDNPFKCPIVSCRQPIPIVRCIKKLLSTEQMQAVRDWYKDIKNPKSHMLQQCPSIKCGKRNEMRYLSFDSTCIYCDFCGKIWCELCIKRCPSAQHDESQCDQSQVLDLCDRYRGASDQIKSKCAKKWPWLPEYAASRSHDKAALDWVTANASVCPRCKTGIERSEGCFHMNCRQCKTHFCYECGEELFPPYYGTHHCWLERSLGQD